MVKETSGNFGLRVEETLFRSGNVYIEASKSGKYTFNRGNTKLYSINAGVPQGSILGPILYVLYTADLPVHKETMTATFTDDTVILTQLTRILILKNLAKKFIRTGRMV